MIRATNCRWDSKSCFSETALHRLKDSPRLVSIELVASQRIEVAAEAVVAAAQRSWCLDWLELVDSRNQFAFGLCSVGNHCFGSRILCWLSGAG